ncbi:uroporphyrinogen-III C-methyltransferase [Maribacter sp. CXY002]|uniref:uroporphyrinogen-III C-methyltransferase n=1 Tax=Maribacter luteocoastalis TaxID=3407671 RepID=UPI003B67070B
METNINPKITLVGAGPGSKDLITIRGLKAIESADVILYDALIAIELLDMVKKEIPSIYVGKRCGQHSFTQDDINILMVKNAFEHGHVVRLKGGDPFIFGRAQEEIDYAESFGIPVTVVPGISSVIAVPESQGIPLAKRGESSSFWVMTATKKEGSFSEDLKYASRSSSTMVIVMGIRKFKEIVTEVNKYRDSNTPIAIIQNGTFEDESCVITTLADAIEKDFTFDISKPGIIVIGKVVSEHPSFLNEEVMRVLHSAL